MNDDAETVTSLSVTMPDGGQPPKSGRRIMSVIDMMAEYDKLPKYEDEPVKWAAEFDKMLDRIFEDDPDTKAEEWIRSTLRATIS